MKKGLKKLFFPVAGFLSLTWFLVRVIAKPSRANYPCMKAAFPVASSFMIYLTGMVSSVLIFKKAKKFLYQSRYALFALTLIAGIGLVLFTHIQTDKRAYALTQTTPDGPNNPMGTGKGIFPGRVVWVHNTDATDENCKNTSNDYWYQDSNTDQDVVDDMVSEAIQKLTGATTDAGAWDAIFRHHNANHGKPGTGYTAGEKFVIKINLNGVSQGKENINTSPQVTYAVLDQLINVVGVAQDDISIGDPNINFDSPHWDKCHTAFPDVHYWGKFGGRENVVRSADKVIFTSDGSMSDWLPQCYLDATYMINLPVLKKHHRGGISLTSKNHFGDFTPFNGSAFHWHFSLPAPDGAGDVSNGDYGAYRCFVDFMGHKDIGGKTILYLVDGLWSSINWGHPPIKWRMAPFNDDWPNSLFASQDPVAIQSVGFDFLYEEFDEDHPTEGEYDPRDNHGPFPHYAGSDDFLHQAADKANWAEGITYDPEADGTPLPESLGAHEHWNNAADKQYSRNLGLNTGIELLTVDAATTVEQTVVPETFMLYPNHPNPFNPATTISYELPVASRIELGVYNQLGQRVSLLYNDFQDAGFHTLTWDGLTDSGERAASGLYICQIRVENNSHHLHFARTQKMILAK
ncbi:DUF362 domain-containing protein [bacterium]|nr:DUF362 domain-containing protein [bacterium]